MAVQANIQPLSNAELGVIQLTTTLTEKAAYKIAESIGDTAGAIGSAIPIFNLITTVVRGIVDTVNAKYETSLNVFNNYEPYDLPFKSEGVEAVAEAVQKWFGDEKQRRTTHQNKISTISLVNKHTDSILYNIMDKVFKPQFLIIAGTVIIVAGVVWYSITKRKS